RKRTSILPIISEDHSSLLRPSRTRSRARPARLAAEGDSASSSVGPAKKTEEPRGLPGALCGCSPLYFVGGRFTPRRRPLLRQSGNKQRGSRPSRINQPASAPRRPGCLAGSLLPFLSDLRQSL